MVFRYCSMSEAGQYLVDLNTTLQESVLFPSSDGPNLCHSAGRVALVYPNIICDGWYQTQECLSTLPPDRGSHIFWSPACGTETALQISCTYRACLTQLTMDNTILSIQKPSSRQLSDFLHP